MHNPFARHAQNSNTTGAPPVAAETPPPLPGFFGKVPTRGDFLSRRMPAAFAGPWDEWLQATMRAAEAQFGSAWLDAWLVAPIWHFALGHGVAGPARAFGILIPSVDRVGRYFPFSILGMAQPTGLSATEWWRRSEALALAALDDGFDPERLDTDLAALGSPGDPHPPGDRTPSGWEQLPPDAADAAAMLDAAIVALAPDDSLWWSGTSDAPAMLLRTAGLPSERLVRTLLKNEAPDA